MPNNVVLLLLLSSMQQPLLQLSSLLLMLPSLPLLMLMLLWLPPLLLMSLILLLLLSLPPLLSAVRIWLLIARVRHPKIKVYRPLSAIRRRRLLFTVRCPPISVATWGPTEVARETHKNSQIVAKKYFEVAKKVAKY